MCTVTLHRTAQRYVVTMNRDEARTRAAEVPPEIRQTPRDIPWIAPSDSEKGGVWIAVNASGLMGCLLNRYQDAENFVPERAQSRGWILPRLMNTSAIADARASLLSDAFPVTSYPPFTLVLVDRADAAQFEWRGQGAIEESALRGPWNMVSSSFFEPGAVLPWRRAAFRAWIDSGAADDNGIPAFHLYCPPGAAHMAPMMSRDISCTRSITQVAFDTRQGTASMRYAPVTDGRPERDAFRHVFELPTAPLDS